MMISDATKRVQLYKVNVSSVTSDSTFKTEVTKVDRKELLAVENPRYQEMINKYPDLKGVHIDDRDAKERRPDPFTLSSEQMTARQSRLTRHQESAVQENPLQRVLGLDGP